MKYPKLLSAQRVAALILALTLLVSFTACGKKDNPTDIPGEETVAPGASEPIEEQPAETVPATMGTVTIDHLVVRKDAGSEYESAGVYNRGDRIEIQETKSVDSTVWGRTGKGWVVMNYVRMDGTADPDANNPGGFTVESNGKHAVLGYGVVELTSLNVRTGPGTNFDKVKEITKGVRYAYYEESDGWVRIEDGWVSTSYFYIEGTTANITSIGTVISDNLNIRTGPGTDFQSIGTCKKGDSVDILAQIDGWGFTGNGWVSMMHVELQDRTFDTGVAIVTSGLNIRQEANADSEKVGTYEKGDVVTILEVENGWGRTDKGWINLLYVKYE